MLEEAPPHHITRTIVDAVSDLLAAPEVDLDEGKLLDSVDRRFWLGLFPGEEEACWSRVARLHLDHRSITEIAETMDSKQGDVTIPVERRRGRRL